MILLYVYLQKKPTVSKIDIFLRKKQKMKILIIASVFIY